MLNILSEDIYPISSFGIYPECTKKDKNKLCQDSSSPNILIQDISELREHGPPGSKNRKPYLYIFWRYLDSVNSTFLVVVYAVALVLPFADDKNYNLKAGTHRATDIWLISMSHVLHNKTCDGRTDRPMEDNSSTPIFTKWIGGKKASHCVLGSGGTKNSGKIYPRSPIKRVRDFAIPSRSSPYTSGLYLILRHPAQSSISKKGEPMTCFFLTPSP